MLCSVYLNSCSASHVTLKKDPALIIVILILMACCNSYNPCRFPQIFIVFLLFCPSLSLLQDIQQAHAGQIVAVFGVDCASGTKSDACRSFF